MSLYLLTGTVVGVWAMLSIIGNERARQIDDSKARHKARLAAQSEAENEPAASAKH